MVKPTVLNLAVHSVAGAKLAAGHDAGVMWPLPKRVLGLVGEIVVLKLVLGGSPAASPSGDEAKGSEEILVGNASGGMRVEAVKVGEEEFAKLLFCDVGVHRRMVYLERAGMLVRAAKRIEEV